MHEGDVTPNGSGWPRRRVLGFLTGAGGSVVFARAFVTLADEAPAVTTETIRQAEWIAGVEYDDAERELMLSGVNELLESFRTLRAIPIDNGVPPALHFRPSPLADGPARAPRSGAADRRRDGRSREDVAGCRGSSCLRIDRRARSLAA